jgi:hypothetical protein
MNRIDLCNPNIAFGLTANQELLLLRTPTASVKFYDLLSIMYLDQNIQGRGIRGSATMAVALPRVFETATTELRNRGRSLRE